MRAAHSRGWKSLKILGRAACTLGKKQGDLTKGEGDLVGPGAVVGILGVPGGDGGIVHGYVEQGQQAAGRRQGIPGLEGLIDRQFVPAINRRAGVPIADLVESSLVLPAG